MASATATTIAFSECPRTPHTGRHSAAYRTHSPLAQSTDRYASSPRRKRLSETFKSLRSRSKPRENNDDDGARGQTLIRRKSAWDIFATIRARKITTSDDDPFTAEMIRSKSVSPTKKPSSDDHENSPCKPQRRKSLSDILGSIANKSPLKARTLLRSDSGAREFLSALRDAGAGPEDEMKGKQQRSEDSTKSNSREMASTYEPINIDTEETVPNLMQHRESSIEGINDFSERLDRIIHNIKDRMSEDSFNGLRVPPPSLVACDWATDDQTLIGIPEEHSQCDCSSRATTPDSYLRMLIKAHCPSDTDDVEVEEMPLSPFPSPGKFEPVEAVSFLEDDNSDPSLGAATFVGDGEMGTRLYVCPEGKPLERRVYRDRNPMFSIRETESDHELDKRSNVRNDRYENLRQCSIQNQSSDKEKLKESIRLTVAKMTKNYHSSGEDDISLERNQAEAWNTIMIGDRILHKDITPRNLSRMPLSDDNCLHDPQTHNVLLESWELPTPLKDFYVGWPGQSEIWADQKLNNNNSIKESLNSSEELWSKGKAKLDLEGNSSDVSPAHVFISFPETIGTPSHTEKYDCKPAAIARLVGQNANGQYSNCCIYDKKTRTIHARNHWAGLPSSKTLEKDQEVLWLIQQKQELLDSFASSSGILKQKFELYNQLEDEEFMTLKDEFDITGLSQLSREDNLFIENNTFKRKGNSQNKNSFDTATSSSLSSNHMERDERGNSAFNMTPFSNQFLAFLDEVSPDEPDYKEDIVERGVFPKSTWEASSEINKVSTWNEFDESENYKVAGVPSDLDEGFFFNLNADSEIARGYLGSQFSESLRPSLHESECLHIHGGFIGNNANEDLVLNLEMNEADGPNKTWFDLAREYKVAHPSEKITKAEEQGSSEKETARLFEDDAWTAERFPKFISKLQAYTDDQQYLDCCTSYAPSSEHIENTLQRGFSPSPLKIRPDDYIPAVKHIENKLQQGLFPSPLKMVLKNYGSTFEQIEDALGQKLFPSPHEAAFNNDSELDLHSSGDLGGWVDDSGSEPSRQSSISYSSYIEAEISISRLDFKRRETVKAKQDGRKDSAVELPSLEEMMALSRASTPVSFALGFKFSSYEDELPETRRASNCSTNKAPEDPVKKRCEKESLNGNDSQSSGNDKQLYDLLMRELETAPASKITSSAGNKTSVTVKPRNVQSAKRTPRKVGALVDIFQAHGLIPQSVKPLNKNKSPLSFRRKSLRPLKSPGLNLPAWEIVAAPMYSSPLSAQSTISMAETEQSSHFGEALESSKRNSDLKFKEKGSHPDSAIYGW